MPTVAERALAVKEKALATKSQAVEKTKALQPSYGRLMPSLFSGERRAPYVTTGPVGRDSAGYSLARAAAFIDHRIGNDQVKEELHISEKLKSFYGPHMFGSEGPSLIVPSSANPIYHPPQLREDSRGKEFLGELKQKMAASVVGADAGEMEERAKALGTYPATAGGSFIPPPTLTTDIIELQRNKEVFSRSGAMEMSFGPNGAVDVPRQTGAGTSYWVGEGATITESTLTTGSLELRAKKLGTLTALSIEGQNFSNPSLEALARNDMARASALKADQAMLDGTGGTQIKGLITYTGASNSYLNIQTVVASTVGANGNTFEAGDVQIMYAYLPDAVADSDVKWVMNPFMFAPIANRRADAVTAGDGKGPFVFDIQHRNDLKINPVLNGYEVIKSRQVAQTRSKGSASNLNYILLGHWPDWMIARYGALEIMMNPYGATFLTGQIQLRAIQFIDAGPRTPNSFIFMDTLLAQ